MKKVIAVILTLAVVFSFSAVALAAGNESGTDSMKQQMPGNFQQGKGAGRGGRSPMMNGQGPAMNGEFPEMNGEFPEMNGEFPEMNGEAPEMNGEAPEMNGKTQFDPSEFTDFDAMVEEGVISQETCDKIKAYLEENMPGDQPAMNGEPPEMNSQAPDGEIPDDLPNLPETGGEAPDFNGEIPEIEGEGPMAGDLLKDLLEAGVITQDEYEALSEALSR